MNKEKTSILFIILFVFLLGLGMFCWSGNIMAEEKNSEEKDGYLIPSQILADKFRYRDKFLVIRGKIMMEDAVCERKSCPDYDPCCGCKNERDLIIVDPDVNVVTRSLGRLRLLTTNKESLCQRIEDSCDYNCQDWEPGKIYEIKGTFRAVPPPEGSGLKIYMDYYFEVNEKEIIKSMNFLDRIKVFINDLKNLFYMLRTGGYYILR